MRYLCQPCSHRWWQHRHPDVAMRVAGALLMGMGAILVVLAIMVLL